MTDAELNRLGDLFLKLPSEVRAQIRFVDWLEIMKGERLKKLLEAILEEIKIASSKEVGRALHRD